MYAPPKKCACVLPISCCVLFVFICVSRPGLKWEGLEQSNQQHSKSLPNCYSYRMDWRTFFPGFFFTIAPSQICPIFRIIWTIPFDFQNYPADRWAGRQTNRQNLDSFCIRFFQYSGKLKGIKSFVEEDNDKPYLYCCQESDMDVVIRS